MVLMESMDFEISQVDADGSHDDSAGYSSTAHTKRHEWIGFFLDGVWWVDFFFFFLFGWHFIFFFDPLTKIVQDEMDTR